MQLEIIGSKIYTEQDFHNQIFKNIFYTRLLWEQSWCFVGFVEHKCRTTDYFGMERCYVLKKSIKSIFIEIVKVLERIKKQDEDYGFEENLRSCPR